MSLVAGSEESDIGTLLVARVAIRCVRDAFRSTFGDEEAERITVGKDTTTPSVQMAVAFQVSLSVRFSGSTTGVPNDARQIAGSIRSGGRPPTKARCSGATEEFAVRHGVRAKRSLAEPPLWFSRPFTIRRERPIFDA